MKGQEVTLEEWCSRLDKDHRVNKELEKLKKGAKPDTVLQKKYDELVEKYEELVEKYDALVEKGTENEEEEDDS